MIIIDGKKYIEKPTTDLPFTNMCRFCAFYGTACYNRDDFSCHSDERADGIEVVFVREDKSQMELVGGQTMKITKQQALFNCYDMWDFLAEYPVQETGRLNEKIDWDNGAKEPPRNDCWLCEYKEQHDAKYCLLNWDGRKTCCGFWRADFPCMESHTLYIKWKNAGRHDRAKYARKIADMCMAAGLNF